MRLPLFFAILLAPVTCEAGLIVYDNEAEFLANAPVEKTLTFNDMAPPSGYSNPLGYTSVEIEGAVFSAEEMFVGDGPAHWSVYQYAGLNDTPKRWGLDHDIIGIDTISFANGGATNALGFYLLTGGHTYEDNFKILVRLTDGSEFLEILTFGYQVNATGIMYRGYTAQDALISSITLSNQEIGPVWTSWQYDNVSYGAIEATAVPEPSALALALIGACVAGLANRKRRKV